MCTCVDIFFTFLFARLVSQEASVNICLDSSWNQRQRPGCGLARTECSRAVPPLFPWNVILLRLPQCRILSPSAVILPWTLLWVHCKGSSVLYHPSWFFQRTQASPWGFWKLTVVIWPADVILGFCSSCLFSVWVTFSAGRTWYPCPPQVPPSSLFIHVAVACLCRNKEILSGS